MEKTDETRGKPFGTVRAPIPVLRAIAMVIAFYWDDEFQHYASLTKEERKGKRHVFQELSVIKRWLARVHGGATLTGTIDN